MSKVAIALFCLGVIASSQSVAQTLLKVGVIDLPGPKGQRFDYPGHVIVGTQRT